MYYEIKDAICTMVRRITDILAFNEPSVYLYGSVTLNDFRLGWSDIDILVLTEKRILESQAETLAGLRQTMLAEKPDDPYYRLFEGGMLAVEDFISAQPGRVVYWGTSSQRITDRYALDSFCMSALLKNGVLLHGKDLRVKLAEPTFDELYADVKRHYETIRQHARQTGRSFYSYGWLLDIARCIYTLRTGEIIAKTMAAQWALENDLCPDSEALGLALEVRRNPLKYKDDKEIFDRAETLDEAIQRFADVLERELNGTGAALPGHM